MEKNENTQYDIFEPGTMLAIGKYEIAYGRNLSYDSDNDSIYNSQVPYWLNGAQVKYKDVLLTCDIDWKETGKSINSISFLMPRDNAYLGDVFITVPYGLIKKNRTGVGVTTLELNSPRNSIVVVPTRALAYNKAINSKIEGEENKYKILYVGGKITGFNVPTPSAYIADSSIDYKKFIVVADSFPRLLKDIGEDNYKDYFLMIDEIDSYQYDCSYRPNMEDVIDYYFQFPPTQRCLVSATIGKFSNKAIEEEPIINVKFNEPLPRTIKLVHTDDIDIRVKKTIEEITSAYPNHKILIAYNSISGCTYIINSLDEELRRDCAMLCSTKNSGIVEYYSDITNNQLPKKISFMTCTYFVGIDISERFHLISVINSKKTHTVLSTDKLQQIAGRCRDAEGLLSETIIYSTKAVPYDIDPNNIENQVLKDAQQLSNFGTLYPILREKFTSNFYLFREEFDSKELIEGTAKRYYGTSPVKILRKNVIGQLVPSFFNIDNVRIQVELLTTLFNQSFTLRNKLVREGHHVEFQVYQETTSISDAIIEETDTQLEERNQFQQENIISRLQEVSSLEERKSLARRLHSECTRKNAIFLEYFIELQEYVPFNTLIEKLPQFDKPKNYNSFYNYVLFWALEDNHSIKGTIYRDFPLNERFTGNELTEKFNNIYSGILGYNTLSSKQAMPLIRTFCTLSSRTTERRDGSPINIYKILNYNPFGFTSDIAPLQRISSSQDMRSKFRFS